jgi:hypothetical protein
MLEDGSVRALAVKVGDRVLFGKYAGQTVKVDGEELLVMREEDIMGVIEPRPPARHSLPTLGRHPHRLLPDSDQIIKEF